MSFDGLPRRFRRWPVHPSISYSNAGFVAETTPSRASQLVSTSINRHPFYIIPVSPDAWTLETRATADFGSTWYLLVRRASDTNSTVVKAHRHRLDRNTFVVTTGPF